MLFAGACSVKKLVLLENKSVNDFKVIGGIKGDDAIEPGAPPTCFCGCCPATPGVAAAGAGAGAATGAFIFGDDDDEDDARLRRLRFFFGILTQILESK